MSAVDFFRRSGVVLFLFLCGSPALAQTYTRFPVPTANAGLSQIAAGPDGGLWFTQTQANKIGRITTSGQITEYPLAIGSYPLGITAGPDGAIWFTQVGSNKIGRISPQGVITETAVPTANSGLRDIAMGTNGTLWFTEESAGKVARLQVNGVSAGGDLLIEFSVGGRPSGITAGPDGLIWFIDSAQNKIRRIGTDGTQLTDFNIGFNAYNFFEGSITVGPDGALWFTEVYSEAIGRITTGGQMSHFKIPAPAGNAVPYHIAVGPDGAMWFGPWQIGGKPGRISVADGSFTQFDPPTSDSTLDAVALGADGALWFLDRYSNEIVRMTVPASSGPLFAATLPASRSVQGPPLKTPTVTAFATIVNAGPVAANGCGIVPVTPVYSGFSFQTTNPSTNAVTGTPNTRVTIPANGAQSFVVAFTPVSEMAPRDVMFGFDCAGLDGAPTVVGLNTLNLSFSIDPVPDMISVGVTPSGDGYARTGGAGGTGVFAVATANIGAAAALTARVRLPAGVPVAATICKTNSSTGACLAAPAPTVTVNVGANENGTWTAFLQATGSIPPDPAHARVFVEFVDAGGVVRGSTSTAVTTQ